MSSSSSGFGPLNWGEKGVATGKCADCRAGDRGCNVFTIIEGKPPQTDLNVILVNQDLGWAGTRLGLRNGSKKFWRATRGLFGFQGNPGTP